MRSILPRGPDHAFFGQQQFQNLLSDNFLQIACLTAQVFNLVCRRCTRRITRQPLLAGFKKLLRPAVIEALSDPLVSSPHFQQQ